VQAKAGDKSTFVLTELSTFNADTAEYLGGVIRIASTQYVVFSVVCAALVGQNARLHFTFNGPDFQSHTTDWQAFGKGHVAEMGMVGQAKFFKKGCYTVTVVAETNKTMNGGSTVGTFRLYFY